MVQRGSLGLQKMGTGLANRLAAPIVLVVSCSGTGGEPADRAINLGSHSLHAVVAGTGAPVVVFDGGIGAGCEEYRELQDRIAVPQRW